MEKRLVNFFFWCAVTLVAYSLIMQWLNPPPPQPAKKGDDAPIAANKDDAAPEVAAAKGAEDAPDRADAAQADAPTEPVKEFDPEIVILGSTELESGYRMMVALTNVGAAVEQIELSHPRYGDLSNLEDRSGYLGYLKLEPAEEDEGLAVRAVGRGSPADKAGIQPGDVITVVNGIAVREPKDLNKALAKTRPKHQVQVDIVRDGERATKTATLGRRPLRIIEPENNDPLSFLMTLAELNDRRISDGKSELAGVRMRSAAWEVVRHDEREAVFRYVLPNPRLEITKTYKLARAEGDNVKNRDYPAYHLTLNVEIRNLDLVEHEVSYLLTGPTGLPTEGWWYSPKISPRWSDAAGARDVVFGVINKNRILDHRFVSVHTILDSDDGANPVLDEPLAYVGVDAHYFAVVLIPQNQNPAEPWFARAVPIRVGAVPKDKHREKLTNVTFQLESKPVRLAPEGGSISHEFQIFAGPKRPSLLEEYAKPYGLDSLVYYGLALFGAVASIMVAILHAFYALVGNYGIAIVMLTVLVRSLMFPITRKQAINMQRMQALQPELKKIMEKHKGDLEARGRAQRELYQKHGINPLAGCLPALFQLPIFIGLYRALSVDVELRQAPLISDSVNWASNLGAPDMLWHWEPYLPAWIASETGWLGPYFNLLPCIAVVLFIIQQRMFMPPPTDEQSAMMQKIMQPLTIVIGLLFFKVPAGLCLYIIASSIWSMAERKIVTKTTPPSDPNAVAIAPKKPMSDGGQSISTKKKKRQRPRR